MIVYSAANEWLELGTESRVEINTLCAALSLLGMPVAARQATKISIILIREGLTDGDQEKYPTGTYTEREPDLFSCSDPDCHL